MFGCRCYEHERFWMQQEYDIVLFEIASLMTFSLRVTLLIGRKKFTWLSLGRSLGVLGLPDER